MDADNQLSSYQFQLPPELIAQQPAKRRDTSRLMILPAGEGIEHRTFNELPEILRPGDLLVRNNTRVIPARLIGRRPGGGKSELLLVRRLSSIEGEEWLCLGRPASHMKHGKDIVFGDGELAATVLEKLGQGMVRVEFSCAGGEFREKLEKWGRLPLPPYIERPEQLPTPDDRERYQTTYAVAEGAVAAPTAGLHFTPQLDARLKDGGVELTEVTLHVGPGTFRPVKSENLDEHQMDAEWCEISPETADKIDRARGEGRRVVAVGTTTVRTLESAGNAEGKIVPGNKWTSIFIRPGYNFRTIDGLITNFHLPGSSLVMMISALAGRERILAAYAIAINMKYRFYSYGDAMLIWR